MTPQAANQRTLSKSCWPAFLLICLTGSAAWCASVPHGRLDPINGYQVLSLDGTPEQMGAAEGQLLMETVRRVIKDMITDGIGRDADSYKNMAKGSKVMEPFQPREYLAELHSMADAAAVSYDDLLLLQYFGDVRRGITGPGSSSLCTSFAILPPITREKICLVGRNLDYFDNGVGGYASILAYYRPEGKIPFVTITWAGIINGWTLLNAKGIVVSNNTVFDGRNALEGISTCFLLRYVAERAGTIEEGINLVSHASRTCATAMLIASGNPPDAAIVEFDHENLKVRKAEEGFAGAGNSFLKLYQDIEDEQPTWGRAGLARSIALAKTGQVDLSDNIAGAEGVPITGMNLHSVMIDATHLRLRVAMGQIPACRLPYRAFRLTEKGIEAD